MSRISDSADRQSPFAVAELLRKGLAALELGQMDRGSMSPAAEADGRGPALDAHELQPCLAEADTVKEGDNVDNFVRAPAVDGRIRADTAKL